MKKVTITVIILIGMVGTTFGQQFLWSTVENTNAKYIPYKDATKEVLELYDLYKFYYDGAGYNKETISEFMNIDKNDMKWINDIEERVILAMRIPMEGGSAIGVVCIDKNNVHMVLFSNVTMSGFNMTYNGEIEKDRKRFEKWFKTLLN